jgi:hypothetical protein
MINLLVILAQPVVPFCSKNASKGTFFALTALVEKDDLPPRCFILKGNVSTDLSTTLESKGRFKDQFWLENFIERIKVLVDWRDKIVPSSKNFFGTVLLMMQHKLVGPSNPFQCSFQYVSENLEYPKGLFLLAIALVASPTVILSFNRALKKKKNSAKMSSLWLFMMALIFPWLCPWTSNNHFPTKWHFCMSKSLFLIMLTIQSQRSKIHVSTVEGMPSAPLQRVETYRSSCDGNLRALSVTIILKCWSIFQLPFRASFAQ